MIAQRRPTKAKREKDIEQAVYVMGILKPADFAKAAAELPPKWRGLVGKSLALAWDLLPLERGTLEKFGITPQK